MRKPTIHLNGTSKDMLLKQLCDARNAGKEFTRLLIEAGPNGRDYYPQGENALREAMKEHTNRVEKVAEILKELEELAEHVAWRYSRN